MSRVFRILGVFSQIVKRVLFESEKSDSKSKSNSCARCTSIRSRYYHRYMHPTAYSKKGMENDWGSLLSDSLIGFAAATLEDEQSTSDHNEKDQNEHNMNEGINLLDQVPGIVPEEDATAPLSSSSLSSSIKDDRKPIVERWRSF